MAYEFSTMAGRFRDKTTGQFVGKAKLEELVAQEVARLEVRATGLLRRAQLDRLSVSEFQLLLGQELRNSSLRMAMLAAGGKGMMGPKHYGAVGAQMKKHYERLGKFGQDLTTGELSVKQAFARVRQYAQSIRESYAVAEKQTRLEIGFTEAKRRTQAGISHCRQCPLYATDGWVSALLVTPVGVNCECGGRCRCQVDYRKPRNST